MLFKNPTQATRNGHWMNVRTSRVRSRRARRPGFEVLDGRELLATIIDLGTTNFLFSGGVGINDAGQVVGNSATANGDYAFLYSDGKMKDLGTLGGGSNFAGGINDAGQVVGGSDTANGGPDAFLYSNGKMLDLGTLAGGINSGADGINDAGQVVGSSDTASGFQHAFLYSGGKMTDLGTLGGTNSYSEAFGINDAGQVVGGSGIASGFQHAFLYSGGKMTDLNTLVGGIDSGAVGINDAGQVVGDYTTGSGDIHGYIYNYKDGTMTDLGTLGKVNGINDAGQVIGFNIGSNGDYAFLYSDGKTTDLNTLLPPNSGWKLEVAAAINNSGQIVGYGSYEGADHVFLLTPDSLKATSATSPDSKDISFTYDVNGSALTSPFDVEVYRSSDPTFDPKTAILVGDPIKVPAANPGGESNLSLGTHTVEFPDAQALHPDPKHEYVFVVAYLPGTNGQFDFNTPPPTDHEAHFRKYVLGVLAHGFDLFGGTFGIPAWEEQAASIMTSSGYDHVIPFDWTQFSNVKKPGITESQGEELAQYTQAVADSLVGDNPDDVVDLVVAGHSRGAVVVSQALQDLEATSDRAIDGGFIKLDILDPHPASYSVVVPDYSAGTNLFSKFLEKKYVDFEKATLDPQVVVPSNVDEAADYYQNTPASHFGSTTLTNLQESFLNLWGEAPGMLIKEDPSLVIQDHALTDLVYGSLGRIGHSEVPLYYVQQVLESDALKGYGSPLGLL